MMFVSLFFEKRCLFLNTTLQPTKNFTKIIMGLDSGPKLWAHERSERKHCGPQGDNREIEKQWSPK